MWKCTVLSVPIFHFLFCRPHLHTYFGHRSQSRHIWVRRADYTRKKELAILERLTPEQVNFHHGLSGELSFSPYLSQSLRSCMFGFSILFSLFSYIAIVCASLLCILSVFSLSSVCPDDTLSISFFPCTFTPSVFNSFSPAPLLAAPPHHLTAPYPTRPDPSRNLRTGVSLRDDAHLRAAPRIDRTAAARAAHQRGHSGAQCVAEGARPAETGRALCGPPAAGAYVLPPSFETGGFPSAPFRPLYLTIGTSFKTGIDPLLSPSVWLCLGCFRNRDQSSFASLSVWLYVWAALFSCMHPSADPFVHSHFSSRPNSSPISFISSFPARAVEHVEQLLRGGARGDGQTQTERRRQSARTRLWALLFARAHARRTKGARVRGSLALFFAEGPSVEKKQEIICSCMSV